MTNIKVTKRELQGAFNLILMVSEAKSKAARESTSLEGWSTFASSQLPKVESVINSNWRKTKHNQGLVYCIKTVLNEVKQDIEKVQQA